LLFLSKMTCRSAVYRPVGAKGIGCGLRVGKVSRGSPFISLMIRNCSGSSPITGLTLRATGLYFFFAGFFAVVAIDVNVGLVVEDVEEEDEGKGAEELSSKRGDSAWGERDVGTETVSACDEADESRGENKTVVAAEGASGAEIDTCGRAGAERGKMETADIETGLCSGAV
jgi:hypothetical protein